MKRWMGLAVATATALIAAGVAVAHGLDGGRSVRVVAGTFTATTASRLETRSCTTSDGKTVVTTSGTYTGTASGDPDLTGPVIVHARSTINATDGVGLVAGTLKVDAPGGRDTVAQYTGVYAGGQVVGLAVGHAHSPAASLVANVSAGFSGSGGFTNGKIGAGAAAGAAVELAPARCAGSAVVRQVSEAKGTVSAVSATSISVAGLTCAVPAQLQAKLAGLAVGAKAEIHCSLVNGVVTLKSVKR